MLSIDFDFAQEYYRLDFVSCLRIFRYAIISTVRYLVDIDNSYSRARR
jgi:hypothetical protein